MRCCPLVFTGCDTISALLFPCLLVGKSRCGEQSPLSSSLPLHCFIMDCWLVESVSPHTIGTSIVNSFACWKRLTDNENKPTLSFCVIISWFPNQDKKKIFLSKALSDTFWWGTPYISQNHCHIDCSVTWAVSAIQLPTRFSEVEFNFSLQTKMIHSYLLFTFSPDMIWCFHEL